MTAITNWAGNVAFGSTKIAQPTRLDELQEIVARSPAVRPIGSRHSFNDIADTTGVLVDVSRLMGDITIDVAAHTVSFPAGIRYGELAPELHRGSWALANLASLPHISVAGAIATGTHGSGDTNGTLSAAVSGLEFVDGTGEVQNLERGDPDLEGAVVGLGLLGIITRVTLDIEPAFVMRQDFYRGLTWSRLLSEFDQVTGAGYSVSIYPDWAGDSGTVRVKTQGTDAPDELAGALRTVHGLPVMPGATDRNGVPGTWLDRLPHFRLDASPSYGNELQTEYLLPRNQATAALDALRTLSHRLTPDVLWSVEVRTMKADTLWLSPAFGADTVGIHFTWRHVPDAVSTLVPAIEAALASFDARPHWGKLFAMPASQIAPLYPRFGDFLSLRDRLDPQARFVNVWARRTLGLSSN